MLASSLEDIRTPIIVINKSLGNAEHVRPQFATKSISFEPPKPR